MGKLFESSKIKNVWALCVFPMGTVWALYGHCTGTVWALGFPTALLMRGLLEAGRPADSLHMSLLSLWKRMPARTALLQSEEPAREGSDGDSALASLGLLRRASRP